MPLPLPPTLLTSEPGSFARHTFEVRIPQMVNDIIAWNDYPPKIVSALRALRKEIVSGKIGPLRENAADVDFWNQNAAEHIGKVWLDVPWYWAETYFYRRVLEAVEYFQPGAFFRRDPYAQPKREELDPYRAPRALNATLELIPTSENDAFNFLMHAALWGNRTDLSLLEVKRDTLALEHERANILVDNTEHAWRHLQSIRDGNVQFICDNAGTELFFDLALADFLLRTEMAKQVTLHVKPQPFFVSDTMIKDVSESLDVLDRSDKPLLRQLSQRLAAAMRNGQFILREHPFWVTGHFFRSLPDDLRTTLANASLVVSKGDANYRRLVGDCHWDPTTPFAAAVDYFPATVAALRTLKAELIVGLKKGKAEKLDAEDPTWKTNGKRGVVQFHSTFD